MLCWNSCYVKYFDWMSKTAEEQNTFRLAGKSLVLSLTICSSEVVILKKLWGVLSHTAMGLGHKDLRPRAPSVLLGYIAVH